VATPVPLSEVFLRGINLDEFHKTFRELIPPTPFSWEEKGEKVPLLAREGFRVSWKKYSIKYL